MTNGNTKSTGCNETTMIRGALDMLELSYHRGEITEAQFQLGTSNLLANLPKK